MIANVTKEIKVRGFGTMKRSERKRNLGSVLEVRNA